MDRVYETFSNRIMARAERHAKNADVRGIEQMLAAVDRRDAALGRQRPDAVNALVTAVQAKLDQARELRLARDHWALREAQFEKYRIAITDPIDLFALFARVKPALEDIKALTSVDPAGWRREADDVASYYSKFDGKLPDALRRQLLELHQRLGD